MNKNKQFVINLTASLVNFVVNMGIGFAITPFIVGRVGAEAYGFTGLANTMVGYATLFTHSVELRCGTLHHRGLSSGRQTQGGCLFLLGSSRKSRHDLGADRDCRPVDHQS